MENIRVGDVLRTTARVFRSNFGTLTLMATICFLPDIVFDLTTDIIKSQMRFETLRSALAFIGWTDTITVIVRPLLGLVVLASIVLHVVESRSRAAMFSTLREVLSRFFPILFTSILVWLIVLLPLSHPLIS